MATLKNRERWYEDAGLTATRRPVKPTPPPDDGWGAMGDEDLQLLDPDALVARQEQRAREQTYLAELHRYVTNSLKDYNDDLVHRFGDMPMDLQRSIAAHVFERLEIDRNRDAPIYADGEGELRLDRFTELVDASINEGISQSNWKPRQSVEDYVRERRQLAQGRKPR